MVHAPQFWSCLEFSLFPRLAPLLTIEPDAKVRSVGHHRMPVLLTSEAEYAAWLNPEIVERGPLEGLMRPLADGVLEVEPP
jgi:putative SOS response-associated peptidase YedK